MEYKKPKCQEEERTFPGYKQSLESFIGLFLIKIFNLF